MLRMVHRERRGRKGERGRVKGGRENGRESEGKNGVEGETKGDRERKKEKMGK